MLDWGQRDCKQKKLDSFSLNWWYSGDWSWASEQKSELQKASWWRDYHDPSLPVIVTLQLSLSPLLCFCKSLKERYICCFTLTRIGKALANSTLSKSLGLAELCVAPVLLWSRSNNFTGIKEDESGTFKYCLISWLYRKANWSRGMRWLESFSALVLILQGRASTSRVHSGLCNLVKAKSCGLWA